MDLQLLQIQNARPSELNYLLKTFKRFDKSVNYFEHSSERLSKTKHKKVKKAIAQITEKINTIINNLINILNNFDYSKFYLIIIEKLSLITDSHFNNNQKCFELNQIKQQIFDNFSSFLEPLKEKSDNLCHRTLIDNMIKTLKSEIECINKNELNYIQELIEEISVCNFIFDETEDLKTRSYEILNLDFLNKDYQNLCDCCINKSDNKEIYFVEGFLLKLISELKLHKAVYDIETSENDKISDITKNNANMYFFVISELVKDIGKAKTINDFFDKSEVISTPKDKLDSNLIKNAILTKIFNLCKDIYCIDFNIVKEQLDGYYTKI